MGEEEERNFYLVNDSRMAVKYRVSLGQLSSHASGYTHTEYIHIYVQCAFAKLTYM